MGYYSDLRIALTKRDYLCMVNKNKENFIKCDCIINPDIARIFEYKKNGVEYIVLIQDSIKYYKEFEEIQQFEKYLKEAKGGYVFLRIGDKWNDIEYRNNAKNKELEEPFKFIQQIEENTINRFLSKDMKYSKTQMQYIYTDQYTILDFYDGNKEIYNYIEKAYKQNIQFKLCIDIDINKTDALISLQMRQPNEDNYSEYNREEMPIDCILYYLGYQNEETFLRDINITNDEIEEESEM